MEVLLETPPQVLGVDRLSKGYIADISAAFEHKWEGEVVGQQANEEHFVEKLEGILRCAIKRVAPNEGIEEEGGTVRSMAEEEEGNTKIAGAGVHGGDPRSEDGIGLEASEGDVGMELAAEVEELGVQVRSWKIGM